MTTENRSAVVRDSVKMWCDNEKTTKGFGGMRELLCVLVVVVVRKKSQFYCTIIIKIKLILRDNRFNSTRVS